jgi:hypothetical protein
MPECTSPVSNASLETTKDGPFTGSNEAAMFSGIDNFIYVAPTENLTRRSRSFTVAVSPTEWEHVKNMQIYRLH